MLIGGIACFFTYRLLSLHFSEKIQLSDDSASETRRGLIMDRGGVVLAADIERESLFANPEEVENPAEAALRISRVIGMSPGALQEKLARKKRFVWIARKMDGETAASIRRLSIKGLYFKREAQRVYPHGTLASTVLGFVGMDNMGLGGIEYRYNGVLTGRARGGAGGTGDGAAGGRNVRLTIDRVIQHTAERELEKGVLRAGAARGTVVALETKTGRIAALATYPRFDPNRYWEYTDEERNGFLVVNSYEPGSTFKIIAMAAVLKSHPEAMRERFTCDGKIEIGDATVKCTGRHGGISPDDIIKHSCNVGIIQMMKRVRREDLYAALSAFRFGLATGIELPGESTGLLRGTAEWSGLSKYSMAIGQEISVTSVQMVAAFGALANGGVYMAPTIIEAIEDDEGIAVRGFSPRSLGRVADAAVVSRLLKMMRGVVAGGTGTRSAVLYYDVAGKTGTSQKSMKKGGYYPDKVIASFIGVAPLNDPCYCVLVVLDEPSMITSGGEGAAPVFARMMERILPYSGAKNRSTPAREPRQLRSQGTRVVPGRMPDFRGLRMSQALRALALLQRDTQVTYSLFGAGAVTRQTPEPGKGLAEKEKIMLYFEE